MSHRQFFDEQFGILEETLKKTPESTETVRMTIRGLECSMKTLLTPEEQEEVLVSRHLLKSLLTQNEIR